MLFDSYSGLFTRLSNQSKSYFLLHSYTNKMKVWLQSVFLFLHFKISFSNDEIRSEHSCSSNILLGLSLMKYLDISVLEVQSTSSHLTDSTSFCLQQIMHRTLTGFETHQSALPVTEAQYSPDLVLNLVMDLSPEWITSMQMQNHTFHKEYWLIPDMINIDILSLRLDSQIFLHRAISNDFIAVDEVFAIKNETRIRQYFSTFSNSMNLFVEVGEVNKWERRVHLMDAMLKATIIPGSKLNLLQPDGSYDGPFLDIFKSITAMTNLSIEFVSPDDNQYGAIPENSSSWNGMVGQLQRREADIIPADLSGIVADSYSLFIILCYL